MDENNFQEKKPIGEIILTIVFCICVPIGLAAFFIIKMTSPFRINVDLCLSKDNFVLDGNRIVETIIDETYIQDISEDENNENNFIYTIPCMDKGEEVLVFVNTKDLKSKMKDFAPGDEVKFTRIVYYTKSGWRLYYDDYLEYLDNSKNEEL